MKRLTLLACAVCMLAPLGTCIMATPAAAAGMEDGLEVYLPLNGDLLDASGNGRDGTLVDGPEGTNAFATGKIGQGLDFGLTAGNTEANAEATVAGHDFVSIDYTLTESGTIAIWKKKCDFDYNYETVWDNGGSSATPADRWECWMDQWGPSDIQARSSDGLDGRWDDVDNRSVKIDLDGAYGTNGYQGEWLHITVSWEKNTPTTCELNLYLNGELGDTAYASVWQEPGNKFYIAGGNQGDTAATGNTAGIGIFDELAIWSRKLSNAEIMEVYTDGVLGPQPLAGDLNGDGYVNSTDLDIIRGAWGTSVTPRLPPLWRSQR